MSYYKILIIYDSLRIYMMLKQKQNEKNLLNKLS